MSNIGKNFVLLSAISAVFIGAYLSLYTPLPPGIDDAWKLQVFLGVRKMISKITVLSEMVGYMDRMNMSRVILNKITALGVPKNDPDIDVYESKIGEVPVRYYVPFKGLEQFSPVIIYYHGGGWVQHNTDSHDPVTREFARQLNIPVLSVDYRLAPDFPYPAGFDDCYFVAKFVLQNGEKMKFSPRKVILAGDSAGGNLAAAVALKLRDEGVQPQVMLQLLLHPLLQMFDFRLPSYLHTTKYPVTTSPEKIATCCLLYMGYQLNDKSLLPELLVNNHTTPEMREKYQKIVDIDLIPEKFRQDYIPTPKTTGNPEVAEILKKYTLDPYFNPLMAENLENLPEAIVITAGHDGLRDEGIIYAKRLADSKVKVTWRHYEKSWHADFVTYKHYVNAKIAFREILKMLKQFLIDAE